MDATCTIQDSIHVFNLVHKYVSRILGTYQSKRVGEKIGETEKSPNGKVERSKQVGEKVEEREKFPNRKLIGSKQVGEKIRETGKIPQSEG